MSASAGSRLGPYEIVAPLGAGGMGEVWRAKDTRLDREVAIKILAVDFAANPQFKARLDREARTISQLNHPNVCTLFDVGHQDGVDFLVMELIDGESLADRLMKGRLPIDEVLRHGIEIASALDAAHRHGIVHRDLKPGNVMITRSGAKLLDFGLAKSGPLMTSASGSGQSVDLATEHKPLTEQGTILGTFQYMAPEQLEGMEADARTDIFAFGALLYEMATGRRAFQGKNRTSLIAAIVSGTPQPVSELAPLTPPALGHVIKKCLAKDADDRWQSAHDIADQLRWIAEAGSQAGEAAPVLARRKARLRVAWALHAATALVAILTTFAVLHLRAVPPRVVRSSLLAPDRTQFDPDSGAMVLSPDGRRMAFIARSQDGRQMLWVRPLDAVTAQPLAGTEDAKFPFWSPDSRFIGFFSAGKLRRIDANGGPSQALCDASDGRGGSWSETGTILFTPSQTDGLLRVSSAGGTPIAVTDLNTTNGESSHRFPQFLPDGIHFLYLVEGRPEAEGTEGGFALYAGSTESKKRVRLIATNSSARYARSGHLLFLRDRTLVAQRFDAKKLALLGEAFPVAENMTRTARFESMFSVSDEGLLAFRAGVGSNLSSLVWVDREGRDLGPVGKPADYRSIALSHDGRRVAAAILGDKSQDTDIWVLDLERGTSTRLTFNSADDYVPIWSADDKRIFFTSNRQGRGDVFWKASDGTGVDTVAIADPEWSMLRSLSADGRIGGLNTNNVKKKNGWDISLVDFPEGKVRVLLETPFHELNPMLSPDGLWMTYQSNESGRSEIYVQSLQDEGGKWQISTDGGGQPMWSRGDSEIVFLSPERMLMAVDVKLAPQFTASVPRLLADPKIRPIVAMQYAISRDGNRFLINRAMERGDGTPVTLVHNWTSAIGK
ncbi:MAG TPA: protein kinase [Thermoanaerobaculia bacterium]|nr:protein kinase [Thermoanaerobaculia bacterium]